MAEVVIAHWRKRLLVAETSAILCTLYFCIACAVSAVLAVIAVFKTAETAITAVYVFVFFLNKQIRITDYFSIDYADLPNYLITLPPHFYGHSTNVLLRVLCPPFLCSWRAVENLFSEGIPNPYRRST